MKIQKLNTHHLHSFTSHFQLFKLYSNFKIIDKIQLNYSLSVHYVQITVLGQWGAEGSGNGPQMILTSSQSNRSKHKAK